MRLKSAADRIRDFVTANPGANNAAVREACRCDRAALTRALHAGLVHAAGPDGSKRYYPTAELAAAAEAFVTAEAGRRRIDVARRAHAAENERRKAARKAAGCRPGTPRPRAIDAHGRQVFSVGGVRYTVAPPMRDRFAPDHVEQFFAAMGPGRYMGAGDVR